MSVQKTCHEAYDARMNNSHLHGICIQQQHLHAFTTHAVNNTGAASDYGHASLIVDRAMIIMLICTAHLL